MILKEVGLFEGFNRGAISKKIASDEIDCPREKLLSYLKSGIEVSSWLEYTKCMFSCSDDSLGCVHYSDGEWVWSSEFIHYVEHHNIIIPQYFLVDMEIKRYTIGANSSYEKLKSHQGDSLKMEVEIGYDDKEWRAWLSSVCPDFDSEKIIYTESHSAQEQKIKAKNKGFELPDGW